MGAPTLVGSNSRDSGTSSAAFSITVPAGGVPSGCTLFVAVVSANPSGAGSTSYTVTDNSTGGPNTYSNIKLHTNPGFTLNATALYVSTNLAHALTSGKTITVTPNGADDALIIIAFYATDVTTTPTDVSAQAQGTSTAPSSGNTAALAQAQELVIGIVGSYWSAGGSADSFTPGSGYSSLTSTSINDAGNGYELNCFVEWKEPGSSSAQVANGTLGHSSDWSAICATFKLAATGFDPPLLATPQTPPAAAFPPRPRDPARLPELLAVYLHVPAPPDPSLSLLTGLPQALPRVARFIGPFTLEPLGPVFMPAPPPTPPDPSISLLTGLSLALPRVLPFIGPYRLPDLLATILNVPAPPDPSLSLLTGLPQALPRIARFIGPFPLEPLDPVFMPAPPPTVPPALTLLGALPQALPRLARFLAPNRVPDAGALFPPGPSFVPALLAALPQAPPRALPRVAPFIGPFPLAPLGPIFLLPPVTPLLISTRTLPDATISVAYSTTIAGAGGTTPYTWSVASGSLPAGLSLASSTGIISGTPSAGGASSFTIKLTDQVGRTATAAFSLVVWSLAYAQVAPTMTPIISAVLRAKRGSAARLDLTALYSVAGAPGAGPWQHVPNDTSIVLGTGATQTLNFGANTTAGNRAICALVVWNNSATTATTVTGVSDAKNGSWHKDLAFSFSDAVDGSFGEIEIWSVQLATRLLSTDNITVTWSASPAIAAGRAGLLEYSGLSTATNPVDVSVSGTSANTPSTAPSTGNTAATGDQHEMVLIVYGSDFFNVGWTAAPAGTARINAMGDPTTCFWVGDKGSGNVATAESAAGTLSGTTNWGMAAVVYKHV